MVCVAVRYSVPTLLLLGDTRSSSLTFSTWRRKRKSGMKGPPLHRTSDPRCAHVISALINTPWTQTWLQEEPGWPSAHLNTSVKSQLITRGRRRNVDVQAAAEWLNHRYQSRGYLWHSDVLHQQPDEPHSLDFRPCPSTPVDRTCVQCNYSVYGLFSFNIKYVN